LVAAISSFGAHSTRTDIFNMDVARRIRTWGAQRAWNVLATSSLEPLSYPNINARATSLSEVSPSLTFLRMSFIKI
jgi:hypothetical protein